MVRPDPTRYLWWLVSRASGIVAVILISISVLIGLAMAAKVLRPRLKRTAIRLHEHVALIALGAIVVHGLALLGDQWLKPGVRGIAVPFTMAYRPQFTGLGIIAGYLALLLGPSFYLRRRIGARTWRKFHRASAVIWILAVVHTLGAGSDASKLWLQGIVLVPAVPIVYLLVLRLLHGRARRTQLAPQDRATVAARPSRRRTDPGAARRCRPTHPVRPEPDLGQT